MRSVIAILCCLFSVAGFAQKNDYYLFVGTATTELHVYKFNIATGNATPVSKATGV